MAYCFIEKHVNVPGTMWCECGSLVAGTPIDGYNVIAYLGQGTSGDVYLAEQPALNNRKVVIKIAHRSWNQADIDSFRREAEMLASLSHPYILPIYAYGVIVERQSPESVILSGAKDDKARAFTYSPYLVLPYAEEGSLEDTFIRMGKRPWPLMSVVSMAQEIAEALDYAHARGVLHRDVKPANILKMGFHFLLSDFSVASLIDVEASHVNAPLAGSPAYMAPEVWRRNPGRYSDQYALAVTCFRLLTGEYPWPKMNEGNVQAWLHLHCHVPPQPLQTYRPNLSGAVDLVLQMGMAKDPHKRYETMQAFAADLLDAAEDRTQALDKSAQEAAVNRASTLRSLPLDAQTAGKEWKDAIAGKNGPPSNAPAQGSDLEVSQVSLLTQDPSLSRSMHALTGEENGPITVAVEPFTEDIPDPLAERVAMFAHPSPVHRPNGRSSNPQSGEPVSLSGIVSGEQEVPIKPADTKNIVPLHLSGQAPSGNEGPAAMKNVIPSLFAQGQAPSGNEGPGHASAVTGSHYKRAQRNNRWLSYALILNGLIAILLAAEAYWQSKDILIGASLLLALWPSLLIGPLLARWFRPVRLTTLSWSIFWGVFFGMINMLLSGAICYIWAALGHTFLEWGSAWHQVSEGWHFFVSQVVAQTQPALTPLLLGLWLGVLGGALLGVSIYRNERGSQRSRPG